MTTATTTQTAPSRTPLIAALGFATSAVLSAIGTFWDVTNNDNSNNHSASDYLFPLGVAAVLTAIVFGLVVRTAANGRPGLRSAILGALGVATLIVFWAGAPSVLAAGAIATALVERDETGSFGTGGKAGLALACVAVAGAVVLAITG
jgi:hypothetical protein